MSFDVFIDSLENIPPELRRSFTLMRDLDSRSQKLMVRIDACCEKYKATKKKSEREALRKESQDLFEKLTGYADDKIDLAKQTYDVIDKSIKRMTSLGASTTLASNDERSKPQPLGFDMPLDPNEPKYCICQTVSHGEMVACDNKECPIEWFHFACMNMICAPKGKWYCPECVRNGILKQMRPQKYRSRSRRRL